MKWNWNKTKTKQFQNCFKTVLFQFHFNCVDSLSAVVGVVWLKMPDMKLQDMTNIWPWH